MSLEWASVNYKSANKAKDVYFIVKGFRDLFNVRDYENADSVLAGIDLSKLSPLAMVAFVRTTFPARHKLNNWHYTVELIRDELANQELDAENILRGLVS